MVRVDLDEPPATVSPPGDAPIRAEVFSGIDAVSSLEREWRQLALGGAYQPSVSYDWTTALLRTQLLPQDRVFVVALRRGGHPAGIVPLFVRATRVFGLHHTIVRPLAELKNTHSDLLIGRDPESVSALLAAVRQWEGRWDSIRLSKLVEGHPLTPQLEAEAARHGLTPRRRFRKAAYWMALPAAFDDYFAARSHKFRNYARRAEKKLRAAGPLREVEITTPEAFPDGYEQLLQIERASWKQAHGTSIAAVPREAALYREWGAAAARVGELHLQLLFLGDEPIAHNLGCIHRQTYYYLKTSYAAKYRPLSPATFLRLSLIRRMIDRGVAEIDFCGTPYEWEQQWTDTYRWHHVLSIYAHHWRGHALSMFDKWLHYSSSGGAIDHADPRSQRAPGD